MTPTEKYDACMELHRNGKIDEAVDALQKLVAEHADCALAYNALAAFAKKKGDTAAAIRYAEKYCELVPEDSFGYTILSSYYVETGNHAAAEEALGRAFELRFK